jgi:hypothetical protein
VHPLFLLTLGLFLFGHPPAAPSAPTLGMDEGPSTPSPIWAVEPTDTGEVRGQVVDRGTGRPLPGAWVEVMDGPGPVSADGQGRFVLRQVPTGTVKIRAGLLGYETLEISQVRVTTGRATSLTVELQEQAIVLEGLQVRASPLVRRDDAPVSTIRLTSEAIRRTAGGQTDISRTLLSLPGVVGGVDNRNDLLVRGGGPGENAYWLDGIRIPRINHFETQGVGGGALGLLNVEFIEDTDFYAGAFPARYGDALSSTLVVRNRRGDTERFRGDVTVGASEAGVTIDGPLGQSGNVLFSLRRSYLQLLFQLLDLPIRPAYWDTQLRAEWDLDDRNRITVIGLGAIDDLELVTPDADDMAAQEVANRVLDNDQWGYTTGVVWRRLVESGSVRISFSRSMDRFRFEGRVAGTNQVLVSNDAWEAENRIQLDSDLRLAPRIILGLGGEATFQGIRSDFLDQGGPGRPIVEPLSFQDTLRWWTGAGWGQLSLPLWEGNGDRRLTGTAGIRADAHELLRGAISLSPRLGLALALNQDWELSAGAGRFLQPPPRASLAVEVDGELVNAELPFQESRHLVGGAAWSPSSALRVSLEGFYKPYQNLPRSATDPRAVLQNEGGDYGFVGVEPLVGDAQGRARGAELFLQSQGAGPWYGLASYTLSWSEFRGPGEEYRPSSWDARHAVDLTGGVRWGDGDRWELGTRWRIVSGRPFTPFDLEASPEAFRRAGVGVPDRDRLNEERTPAYHRLDVRVDRRVALAGLSGRVYLDVQNLYNRTNTFGFNYTQDPAFPDNLRPREQIGLLPSIGLTLEW